MVTNNFIDENFDIVEFMDKLDDLAQNLSEAYTKIRYVPGTMNESSNTNIHNLVERCRDLQDYVFSFTRGY